MGSGIGNLGLGVLLSLTVIEAASDDDVGAILVLLPMTLLRLLCRRRGGVVVTVEGEDGRIQALPPRGKVEKAPQQVNTNPTRVANIVVERLLSVRLLLVVPLPKCGCWRWRRNFVCTIVLLLSIPDDDEDDVGRLVDRGNIGMMQTDRVERQ